MADARADLGDRAAEAASDFFNQIFGSVGTGANRLVKNAHASFSDFDTARWTKVIGSVVFYILIRPYIEKLFKYMQDRDRRKEKEKKEKERAAWSGKKAKTSANALRGGGSGSDGKVLGEVENTDDEVEDDEEADLNLAMASGVPEWNQMARKRQKKYIKNLKKQSGERAQAFTEEQIMEMLDWSESEDEKEA